MEQYTHNVLSFSFYRIERKKNWENKWRNLKLSIVKVVRKWMLKYPHQFNINFQISDNLFRKPLCNLPSYSFNIQYTVTERIAWTLNTFSLWTEVRISSIGFETIIVHLQNLQLISIQFLLLMFSFFFILQLKCHFLPMFKPSKWFKRIARLKAIHNDGCFFSSSFCFRVMCHCFDSVANNYTISFPEETDNPTAQQHDENWNEKHI